MNDDTRINIELQIKFFSKWDRRNLFYLAKMFSEDLKIGEKYDKLKQCICISILDFNLTDRPKYHSIYRLRDEEGHEFSDLFEIHIIELKKRLNGIEKVDDWIRLFNAQTEEDLTMIKTKNPGILEAMKELRVMSLGKRLRLMHEERLKEIRDRNAIVDYAREQGIEQGIEQGKEQNLMELIRRKLAKGQSVEQIAEALEEQPERISELIEKMKD